MSELKKGEERGTSGTGRLDGRVVVVIGGTSGIGRSAVVRCLEEGARIVTLGLAVEGCEAVDPERELLLLGDARDAKQVEEAVELARRNFGGFNALLHVAGGSGRRWGDGPLHGVSEEAWDETLRLNLSSVFLSNRAALKSFLEQGSGGVILNVTSVLALAPANQLFATHAYAAAKSGVIGLTRSLASHYASQGIRVNAVAPGLVETPMSLRAQKDRVSRSYAQLRQPLGGGRLALPQDLDGTLVFLLSDESRLITGQVIPVDGGWSVSDAFVSPPDGRSEEAGGSMGSFEEEEK